MAKKRKRKDTVRGDSKYVEKNELMEKRKQRADNNPMHRAVDIGENMMRAKYDMGYGRIPKVKATRKK